MCSRLFSCSGIFRKRNKMSSPISSSESSPSGKTPRSKSPASRSTSIVVSFDLRYKIVCNKRKPCVYVLFVDKINKDLVKKKFVFFFVFDLYSYQQLNSNITLLRCSAPFFFSLVVLVYIYFQSFVSFFHLPLWVLGSTLYTAHEN